MAVNHEGLLITDLDNAMKTQYLPKIRDVVVNRRFIQQQLAKRNQVEQVGKTYHIGYKKQDSEGFGFNTYNGAIAKARQSGYAYIEGTIKHKMGRIRIYGADISLTKNDVMAYVRGVEQELKNYADAYATDEERIMVGDGGATPLCTVTSVTDAAPCVATVSTTKYLRPGMPIEVLDTNHAAITNGIQVVENVLSSTTFSFTATATDGTEITSTTRSTLVAALASGLLFRQNSYNNEWHGMKSLIGTDTNTIGTCNRATAGNEFYKPEVYRIATGGGIEKSAAAGSAKDWEIKDWRKFQDRILIEQNGAKKADLQIWTTGNVRDYYVALWESKGGYHEQGAKVDGWPYSTYFFDGVPILAAYYMLDNTAFWCDLSTWYEFRNQEMQWQDKGGSIWNWVSGYDAWEAYTVERKENGIDLPKHNGVIYDLKGIDD